MRIGSLFSGAGGLDLAVETVFGATTAWHSELDPAATKVLAHRWPGVPNMGDITTIGKHPKVGWDYIEPVDILCGGYPCQPFSAAGQRKGHTDDRHLWPYFAQAIRHLRPRYVVLENVAGHRSMGFDSVLADLAGIGYDAQWCSLRASDIGAPHRRERLFVLAADADAERWDWRRHTDGPLMGGHDEIDGRWRQQQTARCGWPTPDPACDGPARLERGSDAAVSGAGPVELLPTPQAEIVSSRMDTQLSGDGRETPNKLGWAIAELLPTPTGRDGKGVNQRGDDTCLTGALLPTPAASDATGGGRHPNARIGHTSQIIDAALLHGTPQWGKYEPAIRRWEALTRPAPPPTEPNTKGNPRLSAAFSEWMMGWPASWVTAVPGISRNDALRIIGNGVVTACAEHALRYLLSVAEVAA